MASLWDEDDPDIQLELVQFVPVLARLNPEAFEAGLLENCLARLMERVLNEDFQIAGFEALTKLVSIYEIKYDDTKAQEASPFTKWLSKFAEAILNVISNEETSSEGETIVMEVYRFIFIRKQAFK